MLLLARTLLSGRRWLVFCAAWAGACSGGREQASEFGATQRSSESESARGRVIDASLILGSCNDVEPDASPLGVWECPGAQYCVDMSAFGLVGVNCRDGSCPLCLAHLDVVGYLSCNDPTRAPRLLLTEPLRIVCSD